MIPKPIWVGCAWAVQNALGHTYCNVEIPTDAVYYWNGLYYPANKLQKLAVYDTSLGTEGLVDYYRLPGYDMPASGTIHLYRRNEVPQDQLAE